ncbi:MAG: phage major capsid protein [Pseudobutyrivibrio sp.]|nr:phage major capsid protein [Pseudobutyrivibrio sp.]
MKYDFSGYATRNDLKCSDGRTIRAGAFKECSGKVVPLVWQHQHDDPMNVLGHALLEERDDGVYAYCSFNETEPAKQAKSLVLHGDVNQLSIYANKLVQKSGDVLHGAIREVSLVIAGANPGAMIDNVGMAHGEDGETDEAVIYNDDFIDNLGGEFEDSVEHADEDKDEEVIEHADSEDKQEEKKMAEDSGAKDKTVQDVIDTMNEEQKKVMMYLVGIAAEKGGAKETDEDEGEEDMKHNVFDGSDEYTGVADQAELTHSQIETIISDGKKFGSLRDSFLAHADDYGIKDIDWLFPEAKTFTDKPEFISRKMEWVSTVMSGVHKSPFSRIKSMFADITEDEARAKGYIKGNLKKEEVFSLLKRTTTPTTIYKKQKLDRDDIIDITDFDVVAWIKAEMRVMLDEEIARAILVGDGRLSSDDDKINEDNIRPIWKEADLFCIKKEVTVGADADATAKNFIRAAIKARKDYRGSGNPILFTTEDNLTDILLLEDSIGHKLYKTEGEVATAMRVSKIVTVPVMENLTRTVTKSGQAYTNTLMGIIINLNDYNVGADKGGAISMFDDFDIDYNQQKYLIETRCSGALTKPYSAIVLEKSVQGAG